MKLDNSNTYIFLGLMISLYSVMIQAANIGSSSAENPPDNLQNQDYYEDDDASEQVRSSSTPKSTILPYFQQANETVYAKEGERVTLDCPAKYYNEKHHTILWYKDEHPITNGLNSLNSEYVVDKSFHLIIQELNKGTSGNYYCSVIPSNVRRNITVTIGEKPKSTDSGSDRNIYNAMTIAVAFVLLTAVTYGQ